MRAGTIQPIALDAPGPGVSSGAARRDAGMRGIVISDLHLLSGRERPEIEGWLSGPHPDYAHWVLNGDILDLKWAPWPPAETARRALEWMTRFAQARASAQVHWLMGNHEGYESLRLALETAQLPANLHWYPEYCLLGDHLFLHGDLLLLREPRTRRLWPRLPEMPKSEEARKAYEQAMKLHLHRAAAMLMQPQLLVRWMARHLPRLHPEAWAAARHIVTGHSHRPYRRFVCGGKLWSNTGSAVRGIRFLPMEFQLAADDETGGQTHPGAAQP